MADRNYRTSLTRIPLSDVQKKEMLQAIADFYEEERDETVGLIEQQQVLDLFLERLAPVVYNQALEDARNWAKQMLGNLDSDYYMLYRET